MGLKGLFLQASSLPKRSRNQGVLYHEKMKEFATDLENRQQTPMCYSDEADQKDEKCRRQEEASDGVIIAEDEAIAQQSYVDL